MTYVDGFIVPIPQDKIEDYRKMATQGRDIWLKHGALDYKECVADDVDDKGFCATFPGAFNNVQAGETVIFAFIVYKSREHRDEVNAKVMADPDLKCDEGNMPFDPKRMAYGGFKTLVE